MSFCGRIDFNRRVIFEVLQKEFDSQSIPQSFCISKNIHLARAFHQENRINEKKAKQQAKLEAKREKEQTIQQRILTAQLSQHYDLMSIEIPDEEESTVDL